MWALGKFALLIVISISGLLLLVSSLPWLSYLLQDVPLPSQRMGILVVGNLGSAAVLGTAIWLYWRLDLQRRRTLEQCRQAHAAARLNTIQRDAVFEARVSLLWPLLLPPITVLSGFGTISAAEDGRWGFAALSFALTLTFLWSSWQLARQLLRPGPLLRMDATGIDHAMYGPIPWSGIIGIQLQSQQTRAGQAHTLMLGVRDARRYLSNTSALARWLYGGRKLRGSGEVGTLTIPLNMLTEDPELIHQSAISLRKRAGAPLVPYWHPHMEANKIDMALRMHALGDEFAQMAAWKRALPDNPSAEQFAEFKARSHEHMQRNLVEHDALMTVLDDALKQQCLRSQRDIRRLRILRWLPLVVVLAWLLFTVLR